MGLIFSLFYCSQGDLYSIKNFSILCELGCYFIKCASYIRSTYYTVGMMIYSTCDWRGCNCSCWWCHWIMWPPPLLIPPLLDQHWKSLEPPLLLRVNFHVTCTLLTLLLMNLDQIRKWLLKFIVTICNWSENPHCPGVWGGH